jgi:hypothetical protein
VKVVDEKDLEQAELFFIDYFCSKFDLRHKKDHGNLVFSHCCREKDVKEVVFHANQYKPPIYKDHWKPNKIEPKCKD